MESSIQVDLGRIAQDLQIRRVQVESIVQLLDTGNTVPFITRYRKERTGNLNEVVIREVQARVRRLRELTERKETILKSIDAQGKLTEELGAAIRGVENPKRLEDLYLPFKPKKRTKASEAREKGLEPLAVAILGNDPAAADLVAAATAGLNPEKELDTVEKVLEGASHIIAETFHESLPVREAVRRYLWKAAKVATAKAEVPEGQGLDFRDYFGFSEPISHVPPHRVLAINRGDKEGVLKVKIEAPRGEIEAVAWSELMLQEHPHIDFLKAALNDAIDRLLLPSLEREIRRDLSEMAERHAVEVFARNLRSLLLQPPVAGQIVLAVDPGLRSGCKLAVLGTQGELLDQGVIHPHAPQNRRHEAKHVLKDFVGKHQVTVVAIGNGTACRETEELIAEIIAEGARFSELASNPSALSPSTNGSDDTAQIDPDATSELSVADHHGSPDTQVLDPAAREIESDASAAPEHQAEPEAGADSAAEASVAAFVEPIAAAEEGVATYAAEPEEVSEKTAAENWADEGGATDAPIPESVGDAAHEPATDASQPATPSDAAHDTATPASDPASVGDPAQAQSSAAPAENVATPTAEGDPQTPIAESHRPAAATPTVAAPPAEPMPHPADQHLAKLVYLIVNEAGASHYSTSAVGREEFPDSDAILRGTVSIGRRLLDPLSELVKIDPQNIGVGLYQHDVNHKQLKESLESVVESCVNFVGVNLNTASAPLLRHVSGLNQLTARRLVDYRKEKGPFSSRDQLQSIEGVGPVVFTQAAGFLKIREGANPLDQTWVHPESYAVAERLLAKLELTAAAVIDRDQLAALNEKLADLDIAALSRELEVGEPTLQDICDALSRPDRDPRDDLPKPIFKRGVLKLDDLAEGMELKGTVLNVVDFGAFVDIGLKDSGLVHISQLANRYVKSPHDIVAVGDVVTVWVMNVDHERKRVSLTMIRPGTERARGPQGAGSGERGGQRRQSREGGGGGVDRRGGGAAAGPRPPRRDAAARTGVPAAGSPGQAGSGPEVPATEGGTGAPAPGGPQRRGDSRPAAARSGTGPPPRGGPGGGGQSRGPSGPGSGSGGGGGPGRGGGRPQHGAPAGPPQRGRFDRPQGAKPAPRHSKPAPPPPPLSKDALSGNVPLRTFGQLKQLWQARVEDPPVEPKESKSETSYAAQDPGAAPPPTHEQTQTPPRQEAPGHGQAEFTLEPPPPPVEPVRDPAPDELVS